MPSDVSALGEPAPKTPRRTRHHAEWRGILLSTGRRALLRVKVSLVDERMLAAQSPIAVAVAVAVYRGQRPAEEHSSTRDRFIPIPRR
jgi:hypothetical protein